MKFYTELSVPKSTPADAPATLDLKLSSGVIRYVSLYFPPGSGGKLFVQIWLDAYQLIPWQRGAWMRGDDLLVPDFGTYLVASEPRILTLKGYNTSTVYPHSALIGVEVTEITQVQTFAPGEIPGGSIGA